MCDVSSWRPYHWPMAAVTILTSQYREEPRWSVVEVEGTCAAGHGFSLHRGANDGSKDVLHSSLKWDEKSDTGIVWLRLYCRQKCEVQFHAHRMNSGCCAVSRRNWCQGNRKLRTHNANLWPCGRVSEAEVTSWADPM